MFSLSDLYVWPIKSMRGLQLSHAKVCNSGLAFDRILMVTDQAGKFITARQFPHMLLFTPALIIDGLCLTAPDGSSATIRFADFSNELMPTEVWGDRFPSHVAPREINQWLSSFFPIPVQLRFAGIKSERRRKQLPDIPLAFADGYPFLLINSASLEDLQGRTSAEISLAQFRANMIVTGATAWDEDNWARIRIGKVDFKIAKPCRRCLLITINHESGTRHPDGEPLTTLQTFRRACDGSGDVDFGLHLVAENSGIIRITDGITVLERKTPRQYLLNAGSQQHRVQPHKTKNVTIIYQGQPVKGNNQQVLLEQLEEHGFSIPYSCRAGLCGSCRLKLISGQVHPLKQDAISDDRTILSCCCIPASDIELVPL